MRRTLIFVCAVLFCQSSFSFSLGDKFKVSRTKDAQYRYEFSLSPSEHGTRNTLSVKLKCLKNNSVKEESFEVCSLDKESIKMKTRGKKLELSFYVYERADFSEFYEEMDSGKDEEEPKCDLESKELKKVILKGC